LFNFLFFLFLSLADETKLLTKRSYTRPRQLAALACRQAVCQCRVRAAVTDYSTRQLKVINDFHFDSLDAADVYRTKTARVARRKM